MHYCYDDPKKQIFFALASTVLETQTRTRLRAHLGTTMQVVFLLLFLFLGSIGLYSLCRPIYVLHR
jgi:hypothetical protein